MLKVAQPQVVEILRSVGVRPGDGLMIHSALQFLGQPEGGPGMYLDALTSLIGADGTLVTPAFNFGFAKGQPFDQESTPSEGMGSFAEYLRTRPEAQRSPHPLQSVAAIGKHAADLAGRDTPCAFDPAGPFDRLLELDFKLLLLGAGVQFTSMIHYCEQRARVPYRYWKDFTGLVRPIGGEWQTKTYRMFARDLTLDPQVSSAPVQRLLEERGLWAAQKLNYGWVCLCRLADFVTAAEDLLAADPWALVQNRPPKEML